MSDAEQKPSIPETPLRMTRRHVAEGKERIARQEMLIADLEREGHDDMLPDARGLLGRFQDFQAVAEEELARRERAVGAGHRNGPLTDL